MPNGSRNSHARNPQAIELASGLRDALDLLEGQIGLFLVHLLRIETHGTFGIAAFGHEEENRLQFALRAHGSE